MSFPPASLTASEAGQGGPGDTAKLLAIVRIVAGAGCLLFALYKILLG